MIKDFEYTLHQEGVKEVYNNSVSNSPVVRMLMWEIGNPHPHLCVCGLNQAKEVSHIFTDGLDYQVTVKHLPCS